MFPIDSCSVGGGGQRTSEASEQGGEGPAPLVLVLVLVLFLLARQRRRSWRGRHSRQVVQTNPYSDLFSDHWYCSTPKTEHPEGVPLSVTGGGARTPHAVTGQAGMGRRVIGITRSGMGR